MATETVEETQPSHDALRVGATAHDREGDQHRHLIECVSRFVVCSEVYFWLKPRPRM